MTDKNNKQFRYSDDKTKRKQATLELRDIATSLQYGSLKNDQRVQIKMPSQVLELLDKTFSNINRSKLITQLVVQALLQHFKFSDRDFLQSHSAQEQSDLDQMWNYLEERESV
jgi:hypothetical protein